LQVLQALDPCQGEHTKLENFEAGSATGFSDFELRRQFVRYLSYICDSERGGDKCTAILLRAVPGGLEYWLAGNKSPSDDTVTYVEMILARLNLINRTNMSTVENILFETVIKFNHKRIQDYRDLVITKANKIAEMIDLYLPGSFGQFH
jgi:hypothetical protein